MCDCSSPPPETLRLQTLPPATTISIISLISCAPTRKRARAAMPCHVDDLDCLRDLLDGVPMGLRVAQALLSDRLALVLIAGCILGMACLGVMVGKIRSLLCEDINGNEEGQQPPTRKLPPQRTRRPRDRWTSGRNPAQSPDANRVQAKSAQGAPTAPLQAAEPDLPPPGLSARRLEGTPHPEPRAPVATARPRLFRRLVCNADKPSDEAPARTASFVHISMYDSE